MRGRRLILVVVGLVLLAAPVVAHVPEFAGDNTTPERAVEVGDAVKSWSFYDELDRGSAAYYRFSLDAGQQLRVGTFTPVSGSFTPSLVVMSDSLNGSGDVPPGVTVPEGMGAEVIEGERPGRATYEPFGPAANYHTASIDRPVETASTYLVAVYEPENRSGPAGVAIGYTESFTVVEYLTVPFDLVRTHVWAGQHPILAVGPFLATVLAGAVVGRRRLPGPPLAVPLRTAVWTAGVLCAGTGVNTLVQTGLALSRTGLAAGALVTAVFVLAPLACGGWAAWLSLRDGPVLTRRTRIGLATGGAVTLLTWAGFLLGPALLLGAAVVPRGLVDAGPDHA